MLPLVWYFGEFTQSSGQIACAHWSPAGTTCNLKSAWSRNRTKLIAKVLPILLSLFLSSLFRLDYLNLTGGSSNAQLTDAFVNIVEAHTPPIVTKWHWRDLKQPCLVQRAQQTIRPHYFRMAWFESSDLKSR